MYNFRKIILDGIDARITKKYKLQGFKQIN